MLVPDRATRVNTRCVRSVIMGTDIIQQCSFFFVCDIQFKSRLRASTPLLQVSFVSVHVKGAFCAFGVVTQTR